VKEKFIKEWGPAAKTQMEADAAEGKQSSDSVMLMNSLFVSYNTFCSDDASKKKKAKEKAMEARTQMNNYECAIGAQPPGAKYGSGVASGLSFTTTTDGRTTGRKRTNVSSKGMVPVPPGGIDGNPGSTIGLVTGVMQEFKTIFADIKDSDDNGPRSSKRMRYLKVRATELEQRKEAKRQDARLAHEIGDVASKEEAMGDIAKLNAELKQVQTEMDEEHKVEDAASREVIVAVSNNHLVTPGSHVAARQNALFVDDDEVISVDSDQNDMTPAHGAAQPS
jgi:hypothetical protein